MNKEIFNYEHKTAICNAILLAFKEKMIYDYIMPESYYINKRLQAKLKNIDICPSLRNKIEYVIETTWDSDSYLNTHMIHSESIFRDEWFYGWGNLYTWRDGRRNKAIKEMKKFLTKEETKDIKKVWAILKIHNLDYPDKSGHQLWND